MAVANTTINFVKAISGREILPGVTIEANLDFLTQDVVLLFRDKTGGLQYKSAIPCEIFEKSRDHVEAFLSKAIAMAADAFMADPGIRAQLLDQARRDDQRARALAKNSNDDNMYRCPDSVWGNMTTVVATAQNMRPTSDSYRVPPNGGILIPGVYGMGGDVKSEALDKLAKKVKKTKPEATPVDQSARFKVLDLGEDVDG